MDYLNKYKGFMNINENNIDMSKYNSTVFGHICTVISNDVHDGIKETLKKKKDVFYKEDRTQMDDMDISNMISDLDYYLDMGETMENMYKDVHGEYPHTSSMGWYKRMRRRLDRNQLDNIYGSLGLKDQVPYTDKEKEDLNKMSNDIVADILRKREEGTTETEERIVAYVKNIISRIDSKERFSVNDYDEDGDQGATIIDEYDDEESEELVQLADMILKDGTYRVSTTGNMIIVTEHPPKIPTVS